MALPFEGCPVCERLSENMLVELDHLLMSNPRDWDTTLFAGLVPPPGTATARYRKWGACRLAKAWLADRQIEIPLGRITKHYQNHLPVFPSTSGDAMESGRLSDGRVAPTTPSPFHEAIDYRLFFNQGMRLGQQALTLLEAQVDHLELAQLIQVASLAARLATAQAGIMTRAGVPAESDEIGGFMGEKRARFGANTIRVIDGEAVPLPEGGRADWEHRNTKADERGEDRMLD